MATPTLIAHELGKRLHFESLDGQTITFRRNDDGRLRITMLRGDGSGEEAIMEQHEELLVQHFLLGRL